MTVHMWEIHLRRPLEVQYQYNEDSGFLYKKLLVWATYPLFKYLDLLGDGPHLSDLSLLDTRSWINQVGPHP